MGQLGITKCMSVTVVAYGGQNAHLFCRKSFLPAATFFCLPQLFLLFSKPLPLCRFWGDPKIVAAEVDLPQLFFLSAATFFFGSIFFFANSIYSHKETYCSG
jgi:hypothetical protein